MSRKLSYCCKAVVKISTGDLGTNVLCSKCGKETTYFVEKKTWTARERYGYKHFGRIKVYEWIDVTFWEAIGHFLIGDKIKHEYKIK